MKYVEKMLVCIVCLLVHCLAAKAVTSDSSTAGSPYQGIVDRNVFGLKPPPPPPDPELNKPPPPKIILTGITTIFGNKRALMKATPPAKPPEPAKEQTYMLAEGQRDGDIEVLEIDEKVGTVKVNNAGTIMTINFDKDGVKLTSTLPAGAPIPGMAAPAPGGIPAPGGNPFAAPGGGFNKAIPTRTLRLPTATGASVPAPGAETPTAATGASSPGFTFGSGSTTTPQPTQPANTMTPEEQEIMTEANHQVALQKGNPAAGLFPPTRLNPNRNVKPNPNATQNPPGF